MADTPPGVLARMLRKVAADDAAVVTDVELLRRFARDGDQAAFELLLWRHGPMVLRACRAILRHDHDAEDAFQAAFLTLARKAGTVGRGAALAAWLHRVAVRIAFKVARRSKRRAERERDGLDLTAVPQNGADADAADEADSRRLLHEEVERLPAKYRAAVVLCYLEGKTNDEAAAHLGWKTGTLSGRLARARELLRKRLQRRGALTLWPGLPTGPPPPEAVEPPAELMASALRAAVLARAGEPLAGAVSPEVLALSEGAVRAMFLTRCKLIGALALLVLAAGVGLFYVGGALAGGQDPGTTAAPPAAGEPVRPGSAAGHPDAKQPAVKQPAGKPDVIRVASPREGIVVVIGTEAGKGEEIPAADRVEVKRGGKVTTYRRLREGDVVERGQMLALIDDGLSQIDLRFAQAKVAVARAEHASAHFTYKEAQARLERLDELRRRGVGAISAEEYSAAVLARDRHREESVSKEQMIRLAEIEVERAKAVVDQYLIRSPVRGIIQKIERRPGEGVRALDTVMEIRIITKK